MSELYKVTLFGVYEDGDDAFRNEEYFSSKTLAIDHARRVTNETMTAEHNWRKETIHNCDLYVHVIRFIDSEGKFRYDDSGIFSSCLADGTRNFFENTKPVLSSL